MSSSSRRRPRRRKSLRTSRWGSRRTHRCNRSTPRVWRSRCQPTRTSTFGDGGVVGDVAYGHRAGEGNGIRDVVFLLLANESYTRTAKNSGVNPGAYPYSESSRRLLVFYGLPQRHESAAGAYSPHLSPVLGAKVGRPGASELAQLTLLGRPDRQGANGSMRSSFVKHVREGGTAVMRVLFAPLTSMIVPACSYCTRWT